MDSIADTSAALAPATARFDRQRADARQQRWMAELEQMMLAQQVQRPAAETPSAQTTTPAVGMERLEAARPQQASVIRGGVGILHETGEPPRAAAWTDRGNGSRKVEDRHGAAASGHVGGAITAGTGAPVPQDEPTTTAADGAIGEPAVLQAAATPHAVALLAVNGGQPGPATPAPPSAAGHDVPAPLQAAPAGAITPSDAFDSGVGLALPSTSGAPATSTLSDALRAQKATPSGPQAAEVTSGLPSRTIPAIQVASVAASVFAPNASTMAPVPFAAEEPIASLDGEMPAQAPEEATAQEQEYSRQLLHLFHGEDGVHAFIRDAELKGAQLRMVAQALTLEFGSGGQRLAGLTVNGKRIALAPGQQDDTAVEVDDMPPVINEKGSI